MPTLSEDLAFRGLVHQVTDPALLKRLDAGGMTVYAGFDPTADSLHVGNMLQLCTLRRFQLAGHRPISLAGGGTGMIGDPGGKLDERAMLTKEVLSQHLEGIRPQLAQFLDLSNALLLDNSLWLSQMTMLDFLRDVGKHFTVNQMVAKESVKTRFERPEQGISYTEFSYMLLQAYDFMRLHVDHGCDLQIGGSDQWGNITMGVDYIRKVCQDEVWGLTTPLVVKADGTKYGKTESGTVWLDPARTSPFAMYQFFYNTADALVGPLLRYSPFSPTRRSSRSMPRRPSIPNGGPPSGRWPGLSSRSCTARRKWPSARKRQPPSSAPRSPPSARRCCSPSLRTRLRPRSHTNPSWMDCPSSTRSSAAGSPRRVVRRGG
jgi:tyrosyl-tRNA synthetase